MAVPFSRVSTRLNDCIGIPYPHSEWMDLSPFLILAPPVVRMGEYLLFRVHFAFQKIHTYPVLVELLLSNDVKVTKGLR
jgi:hypothetical protein